MRIEFATIFALALFVSVIKPFTIEKGLHGAQPVSKPGFLQQNSISTCLNRTDIPSDDLDWVYAPSNASELHTDIDYFFLAGQLIKIGAVDASSCPAAGMGALEGYANACGMAAARPLVIQFQNAYDDMILQAWRDVGVPPVLLKQLIKYESQFFPSQTNGFEIGFGHVTFSGARIALLWNRNLFQEVCTIYGNNCDPLYFDILNNTLLNLMDAACPNCAMKIDLPKAQRSVHYLAETLLAYCNQTSQIVYNATKMQSGYTVGYATIWKLTLMNYNAGPNCVLNTVRGAFAETQGPISWEHIVNQASNPLCQRGVSYANQITGNFYNFSNK